MQCGLTFTRAFALTTGYTGEKANNEAKPLCCIHITAAYGYCINPPSVEDLLTR